MPKAPSTFLRDAEAVAAAVRVKLPKPWKRKAAALEQVRAWLAVPGAPAREKHGWRRAAILKWHEHAPLKLPTGNGKVEPAKATPPPAELPPQTVPAPEGELFLTAEQKLQARLDRLEDMYLRPEAYETKIAQWEVAELRQYRPEIWARGQKSAAAKEHTESLPCPVCHACTSIADVAATIMRHFNALGHSVDVRKQYVSKWKAGEGLPNGVPSLPPPDPGSNRWQPEVFLPWYARYILPRTNGSVTRDLGMNLIEERDRAELEEIAHARFLREKERGAYVAKAEMRSLLAGLGRRFGAAQDKLLEDRGGVRRCVREAAYALRLPEAAIDALDAAVTHRLRARNDEQKADFAAAAADLGQQLQVAGPGQEKESP